MWYDEAVVYQIYPLGLCGAPLQNDGDQSQADNHRILRVLDWVEHIKRWARPCVLFNRCLRAMPTATTPATTTRSTAAWARTTTSSRSARRCMRRASKFCSTACSTMWGAVSGRPRRAGKALGQPLQRLVSHQF